MSEAGNDIVYGAGFARDAAKLPKQAQEKLAELLHVAAANVFDFRLHTKPLGSPLHGKFSFRITRDWRVGFDFPAKNTVRLLLADHRDKIYKRMERLP